MYTKELRLTCVFISHCLTTAIPVKAFAYFSHSPAFSVTVPVGWQTEHVNGQTVRFYPPGEDIRLSNPKIGLAAFPSLEGGMVNADFDYFTLPEITANHAPTAHFRFEPLFPKAGGTISFTSLSEDTDADILTYNWYIDDMLVQQAVNSPNWTWNKVPAGEHDVKLAVDDGKGGNSEYSMNIYVSESESNIIT